MELIANRDPEEARKLLDPARVLNINSLAGLERIVTAQQESRDPVAPLPLCDIESSSPITSLRAHRTARRSIK